PLLLKAASQTSHFLIPTHTRFQPKLRTTPSFPLSLYKLISEQPNTHAVLTARAELTCAILFRPGRHPHLLLTQFAMISHSKLLFQLPIDKALCSFCFRYFGTSTT